MNYVPQGSPYSTQTKLLAAQNNVYPQQPQQGYSSPSWGYEKPVQTPVPAQPHYNQQQQSQQHYPPQQHHPQQQQSSLPVMPLMEPQQLLPQQQVHPQIQQQQQQQLSTQQAIHPQMPVYNHHEYPNVVASMHSQEINDVEKQAFQSQSSTVQPLEETLQFPGQIKTEPMATSSLNNSSQQNHRLE